MDAAFDRAFRWYHEFHATSMVMHTHEKAVDPAHAEAMRENARLAILSVAERAAREGVHLTVENVGYPGRHNVLFDQEQWIALFDQLPDEVGALLDTGHALANGWDLFEVVRRLGTRLRGYHLHNSVYGKDLHRPMFEPGLAYTPEQMDALHLREQPGRRPDPGICIRPSRQCRAAPLRFSAYGPGAGTN